MLHKDKSTDAEYGDGTASSSDENSEKEPSEGVASSSFENYSTRVWEELIDRTKPYEILKTMQESKSEQRSGNILKLINRIRN